MYKIMITIEKVFNFDNSKVRIHIINNKEDFCANDVCNILGYSNGRDAVNKNCEPEGVATSDTLTKGGMQKLTFINEGNLYRLIIKSKLPKAKEFEKLVCEKILPEIRQTGSYSATALPTKINADFLLEVATKMKELEEEKGKLEIELKEVKQENKVLDVLHKVDDNATYNLQTCGKLLHLQPNKFIAKLRELRYLDKNNFPYQDYINNGCFVVKVVTTTSRDLDGSEVVKKREQTFITTKGYKYFEKLLSTEFQDTAIKDLKEAIQY